MRALALLLAALLAAGGAVVADAPAKAPKKHAKRHCKHKHGKKHRCKKKTHKTPVAVQPVTEPAPPIVTAPATPPVTSTPTPIGHLQIVAREYTFTASRVTLAPGTTAIELNNQGQDPHDLRVERADDPGTGFDFALTKPATRTTNKIELTPGEWKLYCTLPGHDGLGMHARVTVAG